MKILYDVCDRAEEELKQICKKPELTQMDVNNMGELVDIIKDITTVEAMKNAEDRDWNREYSRGYEADYSNTHPVYKMARDTEYEPGYSYRKGYSRHSKTEMIEDLKEMMMNARSDEERESYRRTIENLTRS